MTQAKEAQRAELNETIWRIADDLRGSVNGLNVKSDMLHFLFYRFISENLTAYINAGEANFDDAFDEATETPLRGLKWDLNGA